MMLLGVREAFAIGVVSIGFRLFYAIYVDNPQTLNAGWMTALAACAAIVPMTLVLGWIGRSYQKSPAVRLNNIPGRCLFALVALFSIYNAASGVSLLSHSASYVALENVPVVWIRLVCVVAAGAACLGGVDAIGSTAKIWLRILFVLLIIVIVSIVSSFDINYLHPLFGPGAGYLAKPLVPAMGIAALVFPIWLIREKPQVRIWRLSPTSMVITIGLVVAGILAMTGALLPPMLNYPAQRAFQLDKLLTNGRVSVQLQFPLLFIWFGCFVMSLSFSLVLATHMLAYAFPPAPRWAAALICAGASFALSFFDVAEKNILSIASLVQLCAYALATVVLAIICLIDKKRSGAS